MKRIQNHIASIILFGVILIIALSCNVSKKYEDDERAQIDSYLANNPGLAFELKPSGLYYLEVELGSGELAVTHDTVFIMYTGMFLGGTVFDTNVGTIDTLIFPVDEGWVLPGFDEGVTYMRDGGKAKFLVPSILAYGSTGWYPIPGYTPLLFDVELVRLIPGPGP
jgi:FKBP-type peptidyl-prolyl cis-trans isomerase